MKRSNRDTFAITDMTPRCPTHMVPTIPLWARGTIQQTCQLCSNDLGLPFDQPFVVGATTLADRALRDARVAS